MAYPPDSAWIHHEVAQLRETGEDRLADLLDDLSCAVRVRDHETIDRAQPEALSLARENGNPWLSVFIRYCQLRCQVSHRRDAGALPEALDLLEFANQDETAACPHSLHVAQLVVACYAAADGPGYAGERERVSRDGLMGLTPPQPAWYRLTAELVSALRDAGRSSEALTLLETSVPGPSVEADEEERDCLAMLGGEKARALIALGRAEESLLEIEQAMALGGRDDTKRSLRVARCDALLCVGRAEEALADLEPMKSLLLSPGEYVRWSACVLSLCERGLLDNDWQTDRRLARLQSRLTKCCSHRDAIRIAFDRAQLAMRRGRPRTALASLEAARPLVPRLNKELGAPERLQTLQGNAIEKLARRGKVDLPESPDALLGEERGDPEARLERLRAGRRRWPERPDMVVAEARILVLLGRPEEAVRVLESDLDGGPAVDDRLALLTPLLLHAGRFEDLLARAKGLLVHAASSAERSHCHWALALSYKADREPELAREHRAAVERWDVLREASSGIPPELVDGSPQVEPWRFCEVEWVTEDGSTRALHCLQLDADTALVIEMSDCEARYGDLIALEAIPSLLAEDTLQPLRRQAHEVLASGGYDVLSLRDEATDTPQHELAVDALRELLAEVDVRFETSFAPATVSAARSAGAGSAGEEEFRAHLAIPMREGIYQRVASALENVARTWPGGLRWPELIRRLQR